MKYVKTSETAHWKLGDYLAIGTFIGLYLLLTTNAGWRLIGNVISFFF